MITYRHATACVLAALALANLAAPALAATARVRFIALSDIYQMSGQLLPDGRIRGGFARIATLLKAERARGGPVIVAHAGDTLSPSLMSSIDKGAHIIALTNLVAPTVFVPGNHEFDFGKANFLARMHEAKFPLFAANLRDAGGATLPGFKDHTILTVSGVKIGIVGATFEDAARVSNTEDLVFSPTIATLTKEAEALRREGADFLVAVVHAGRGQDFALNAKGLFDLILSGHDHDVFISYDEKSAVVESSHDGHHVVVVEAAIYVAEKDGKRRTHWSPQFRVIDTATLRPDPRVALSVSRYERTLAHEMDVPVASTAIELDSRNTTVRAHEAAIGNLFADAMRESAKSDIAITNGGGIRGGRIYPAGSAITRRHILGEMPLANHLVTVALAGRDVKRALEAGLRSLPVAAGNFPQISGMTIEVDPARPVGDRVTAIKVGAEPLDEAKSYTVATNDFLASGRDGYDMFRDARRVLPVDDAPLIASEVIAYLRHVGTVKTGIDGRIKLK